MERAISSWRIFIKARICASVNVPDVDLVMNLTWVVNSAGVMVYPYSAEGSTNDPADTGYQDTINLIAPAVMFAVPL